LADQGSNSPSAVRAAACVPEQPHLVRGLSLLDSVLLVVGGIIGSGIFLTPGGIATALPRPALFLLVWVVGGLITLLACFAFAELGAMFPEVGGQYAFLREAYGEAPAFLYGWMLFTVGGTGTVATLAVAFAEYFDAMVPVFGVHHGIFSVAGWTLTRAHLVALVAIAVLTVTNILGLRRGATLQNIATFLKFGAIATFVFLGLLIGKGSWSHLQASTPFDWRLATGDWRLLSALGVAMIAVFWTYDGWVYVTWVAGEIKNPQKTLPRALVAGLIIVAACYMAMNLVYLYALPIGAIAGEDTIARAAAVTLFSPAASRWLAGMIAISCFGAMSSVILSGARVYYAMAHDGVFFHRMARVHPRFHTPAFSLVVQGAWASVVALSGTYDQLLTYVMFMMVLSYVATVAGLFVLRWKRPDAPRPYRCTGYPWLPGMYLLLGGAWALNAAWQRPREALYGTILVLIGLPGYFYWRRSGPSAS
jgi:APA family basic amino acid/polyamine antiporter